MPNPDLDVSNHPSDIQVQRNPDDPTVYVCKMMVSLEHYVGQQAGPMRAAGFQIKDSIPACAVLKRTEEGFRWSWVDTTFDIKVEF